jgi:hypothetical protein
VNQYPPGSEVPVVWRPVMSSMRRASFGQEMAALPLLPPEPPPEPPPEEELSALEPHPVTTYVVAPSEAASPSAVTDIPKKRTFLFILAPQSVRKGITPGIGQSNGERGT